MSILFRSAFELAGDIKSAKTSAVEVLAFFLARVEAINPDLNAVVALDVERAQERAQEADAAAERGEDWGPLHGVPMTIKDAFCTEGLVTVGGMLEHRKPAPDMLIECIRQLGDGPTLYVGDSEIDAQTAQATIVSPLRA